MDALNALEELGIEEGDVDGEAEDGCFCEVDIVVVVGVGGLTGII